jgi:chromosome partitioning protein
MKIISIVNQKGGCGKTITSVNLAAALSNRGHKTLLIDLDPQAHATFSVGAKSAYTITDIFEASMNGKVAHQDIAQIALSENLSFIPSSIGLTSIEQTLAGKNNRFKVLSCALASVTEKFEYCVLDCPPNLGIITLNALTASNYSVVPMGLCDFSLRGVEILKNILVMLKDHMGSAPASFYLLNQVDNRSRYAKEFITRVQKQLGNMLLNTQIRTNIHLREAAANGKSIFDYHPESRGAQDFLEMAQEIEGLTKSTSWAPLFFRSNDVEDVYVVGDFNNWQKEQNYRMKKIGDGLWSVNLPLQKGQQYRYKIVAGENWIADPSNKACEKDPFGGINSLLRVD